MKIILILIFVSVCLNERFNFQSITQQGSCDPNIYGHEGAECDQATNKRCKWFLNCKDKKCVRSNIGAGKLYLF
jgi:hypothetical protein